MSHWYLNKKHFEPINNAFNAYLNKDKIVLVDGGAAGKLSEPFDVSPNIINSVRFEPRGKDVVDINENEIYIDGGIWSHDSNQKLHIAKVPTTSSICPPDIFYLSKFDNLNVNTRSTINIIDVNVRSIDSCVFMNEMLAPDFIKLDVHSAELPALEGAKNNINNCIGLLIETWHSPVHLNQGLHFEIEKYAIENGFEVYDIVCAASWKHKYHDGVDFFDRDQYIGSEILFIKKDVNHDKLIKKAFILSLFGYANDAKRTLLNLHDDTTKFILINSIEDFQKNRRRSIYLNIGKSIFHLRNFIGKLVSNILNI